MLAFPDEPELTSISFTDSVLGNLNTFTGSGVSMDAPERIDRFLWGPVSTWGIAGDAYETFLTFVHLYPNSGGAAGADQVTPECNISPRLRSLRRPKSSPPPSLARHGQSR